MVRLVLFVAICFFAVITVHSWPDNCTVGHRCGPPLNRWVAEICPKTTHKGAPCGPDGMVEACCKGECGCEDVRASCCPEVTPPPLI